MNRGGFSPSLFAAAVLLALAGTVQAGALSGEVDGIRVEMSSSPTRPAAKAQTEYVVRLLDRAGQPISGAQVTLRGGMADGMSVVTPLRAAEGAGVYRGRVLFTMGGTWALTLRVARAGKRFEPPLTERVER